MKIYFGRYPDDVDVVDLDRNFFAYLKTYNYNFERAVEEMVGGYKCGEVILYSLNPMIFNFLPRKYIDNVYFIDENNNHVQFTEDDRCMYKYSIMDIGEVLADDSRTLNWKN